MLKWRSISPDLGCVGVRLIVERTDVGIKVNLKYVPQLYTSQLRVISEAIRNPTSTIQKPVMGSQLRNFV